jgi:hypothetical protein
VLVCYIFVPRFTLGSLTIGLDDLLALVTLPFVVAWVMQRKFEGNDGGRGFLSMWLALILLGISGGLLQSGLILGSVAVPSEMWQYVKRAVAFLLALHMIRTGMLEPRRAFVTMLWAAIAANAIGLVQMVESPIATLIATLYAQTETQFEAIIDPLARSARNFSVTGFSTSWGGFAAFTLALSLGPLLVSRGSSEQARPVAPRMLLMALAGASIANIFFSGSRGAMLAGLWVIIAAVLVSVATSGSVVRLLKVIAAMVLVGAALGAIATTYFADRLVFIQYRNEALIAAYEQGENRFEDTEVALSALDSPLKWMLGVGNKVQREEYVSYGVEVEPVFLLVNYGFVGLTLRYGLVVALLALAWRALRMRTEQDETLKPIAAAVFIGLSGYMLFSVGYFFFQEAAVGVWPWLLFGLLVGASGAQSRRTEQRVPPRDGDALARPDVMEAEAR